MAGVAGRSGRKAKPTSRKLAAGNPGKRSINQDEPDFARVVTVNPPEWIAGPARELWEALAPQLCAQQVLQSTDIQNLEAYCAAYGRFRMGQESIARDGITVAGAGGGPIKNPAATVINEAVKQMATYGSMLGLDPTSRQRLTGPKKKGGSNPFAQVLGVR